MNFNPLTSERAVRLSETTRALAARYLSGEYAARLKPAPFRIGELQLPETMSVHACHGRLARMIAERAPLEIVEEEKLAGSAPFLEALGHEVPGWPGMSSISHTTVDLRDAVTLGLCGLERELKQPGPASAAETEFRQAMLEVVQAMRIWIDRYIHAYRQLSQATPGNADRFAVIIRTLERVPENPPRTFSEALQSLWSFWEFQRLCGNWSGLGRVDWILGDYLKRDLAEGTITLDEARELLAHLFIKGTEWCHGLAEHCLFPPGSGDAQVYQNIVSGGILPDGTNVENEVSYLILDIIEELHISDFPVAVRLNEQTSERFFQRIAEVQLLGGGIVSVYNEPVVLAGLQKFGYSQSESRSFTNDGCWEVIVPGKTAFLYCALDTLQVLQRAFDERNDYAGFEELFAAYSRCLQGELDRLAEGAGHCHCNDNHAGTVLSLLMPSCRKSGRSYTGRGAEYSVCAIHAGGLPDVANSLLALKKVVFEQKKLTFAAFADLLKQNWQGHEALRLEIVSQINCYGNDDPEADQMMRRVFDDYAERTGRIREHSGVQIPAGVSTFGREIAWAPERRATAFGKFAHEYLAPNLSPTPGTEKSSLTAVLHSYCKMDYTKTPNGCPLDLRLDAGIANCPDAPGIVKTLLKIFMRQGGFYLQLDVVDPAMLRAAQKEPERFPNLVVRISGWSARFATLSTQWQEMIIRRTAFGRL